MSYETPVVWVHYLPILTTIAAAAFSASLAAKYRRRPTPQLWWWAVGVGFYGLGTFLEALYVGEFIGLVLIWVGERTCAWRPAPAVFTGEPKPVAG